MNPEIRRALEVLDGQLDLGGPEAQLILRTLGFLLESRCERYAPFPETEEVWASLVLPWALESEVWPEDEEEIVTRLTAVAVGRPQAVSVIHVIRKAAYPFFATAFRELLEQRGHYDRDELQAILSGLADLRDCSLPQAVELVRSDRAAALLAGGEARESPREWTWEEKTKGSAASFIRNAVSRYWPQEARIPDEVDRLLTTEWPGNASELSTFREALESLLELDESYQCRGGFWRRLMTAAHLISEPELETRLRAKYRAALLRVAGDR
jgi:hypothetical protein